MSREIYIDAELEPKRPQPRPPLIGTPPPAVKDRPKCPGCAQPRRPYLRNIRETQPDGYQELHPSAREWTGEYHGFGEFCGSTCAAQFANRVVRALFPALPESVRAKLVRRKA